MIMVVEWDLKSMLINEYQCMGLVDVKLHRLRVTSSGRPSGNVEFAFSTIRLCVDDIVLIGEITAASIVAGSSVRWEGITQVRMLIVAV